MNITNLNQHEVEQLQMLLNKMNPIQPQVAEQDPVEKMIQSIMENFEWDRVALAMEYLNWKWCGEHVTVDMLKEEGERLLRGAIQSRLGEFKDEHYELGICRGTGGLEAKAWCDITKTKIDALDLKFVLSSWDESIEDEQE